MEEAYDPLQIKLEIFEGPLDLLLHLIRKHELDIYDIPIAFILEQYLQYLEIMKELNLSLAGEFILMASTLMQIKSKMLLPVEEKDEELQEEDPRTELVDQLIEYERLQKLASRLQDMEAAHLACLEREFSDIEIDELEGDIAVEASIYDLIDAYRQVLKKHPEIQTISIDYKTLSVREKMTYILERVAEGSLSFADLFSAQDSIMDIIACFLALLELIRLKAVRAVQVSRFGTIHIIPGDTESITELET